VKGRGRRGVGGWLSRLRSGAVFDEMGYGLGVGSAVWAVGGFVWPEAGGVTADEGVACRKADESGRGGVRAACST
jgi:hypothetical protein